MLLFKISIYFCTGKGEEGKPIDASRLDMRIGKIVAVKRHPDADTLYVEEGNVLNIYFCSWIDIYSEGQLQRDIIFSFSNSHLEIGC